MVGWNMLLFWHFHGSSNISWSHDAILIGLLQATHQSSFRIASKLKVFI